MINFWLLLILVVIPVKCQQCVTFDLEQDTSSLFVTDLDCDAFGYEAWSQGTYQDLDVNLEVEGESYIYPLSTGSCSRTLDLIGVAAGGIFEFNVYLEVAEGETGIAYVNVIIQRYSDSTYIGANFVNSNIDGNGWHTVRITSTDAVDAAYIVFVGTAPEGSKLLIDSFRYFDSDDIDSECQIYPQDEVDVTPDSEEDTTTVVPEQPEETTTVTPEAPEGESTTVAPEEPEEDTTTVIPEGPEEETTTVTPEEPGGETTTVAPEEPEGETTTVTPEEPEGETTTVTPEEPEEETTTVTPEGPDEETTTVAPEEPEGETTTVTPEEPEGETTTVTPEEPEGETTTVAPEEPEEPTTVAPEEPEEPTTIDPEETTTVAPEEPEGETTTVNPEEPEGETTTVAPEEPEEETTTVTPEEPEGEPATVDPEEPEESTTVTPVEPEEETTVDPEIEVTTANPDESEETEEVEEEDNSTPIIDTDESDEIDEGPDNVATSSFWNAFTITGVTVLSLVIILIVGFFAYELGLRRARKETPPPLVYLDEDLVPIPRLVPRVTKIYNAPYNNEHIRNSVGRTKYGHDVDVEWNRRY